MGAQDSSLRPLWTTMLFSAVLTAVIVVAILLIDARRPAQAQTQALGVPSFDRQRSFGGDGISVADVAAYNLDGTGTDEVIVVPVQGQGSIYRVVEGQRDVEPVIFGTSEDQAMAVAVGAVLEGRGLGIVVGNDANQPPRVYPVDGAIQIMVGDPLPLTGTIAVKELLVGNLDGDSAGLDDIVVLGDGEVRIFRNSERDTFDRLPEPGTTGSALDDVTQIALVDLGPDNALAILVGRVDGKFHLFQFDDTVDQDYAELASEQVDGRITALGAAAIGNNGGPVLIIAHEELPENATEPSPIVSFYPYTAGDAQPICKAFERDPGTRVSSLSAADLNGDARPDLIVGAENVPVRVLLKNPLAAVCPEDQPQTAQTELFAEPTGPDQNVNSSSAILLTAQLDAETIDGTPTIEVIAAGADAITPLRAQTALLNQRQFTPLELPAVPAGVEFAFAPSGVPPTETLVLESNSESDNALPGFLLPRPFVTTDLLDARSATNGSVDELVYVPGSSPRTIAARLEPSNGKGMGGKLYQEIPNTNRFTPGTSFVNPVGGTEGLSFEAISATWWNNGPLVAAASGKEVRLYAGDPLTETSVLTFDHQVKALLLASEPTEAPRLFVALADGSLYGVSDRGTGTQQRLVEPIMVGTSPAVPAVIVSLAAADLVGDGANELVVGREVTQTFKVYTFGGQLVTPEIQGSGSRVAVGDVDGDGRRDIVTKEPNGPARLYFNREGAWVPREIPGSSSAGERLAVGNLDGAGGAEIVVEGSANTTIFSSFRGVLLSAMNIQFLSDSRAPLASAIGDMDNDGNLDLVDLVGSTLNIYRNLDGTGVLTEPNALALVLDQPARGLALGDMNGDGWLDAVVRTRQGLSVFSNTGAGDGGLALTQQLALSFGEQPTSDLALGDLNGDGRLDVAVAAWFQSTMIFMAPENPADPLPLNPTFVLTEAYDVERLAIGDLDGNGRAELVTAEFFPKIRVFENLLASDLSSDSIYTPSLDLGPPVTLAVGDLDGVHSHDLAVSFQYATQLLFNTTSFSYTSRQSWASNARAPLVLGDLNRDGRLDISSQFEGGLAAAIFNRNAAPSGQASCTSLVPAAARCFGPRNASYKLLHVADMNGDGHLDIIATRVGGKHHTIYFNDGGGRPTLPTIRPGLLSVTAIVDTDLDRDGASETIIGRPGIVEAYSSFNSLVVSASVGALDPRLASGDFDGDGWDDLAVADGGGAHSLLFNRERAGGGRSLTASAPFGVAGLGARAIAAGRLDGDSRPDLVVAYNNGTNLLLLNTDTVTRFASLTQGDINCQQTVQPWRCVGGSSGEIRQFVAADLDADADLDLVVAGVGQNAVFLNDGAGGFATTLNCTLANVRCFGGDRARLSQITVADVNADGRMDLVAGEDNQPQIIFFQGANGTFNNERFRDCFAPDANVRCFGAEAEGITNLTARDFNGDGRVDAAVGAVKGQSGIYLNSGDGALRSAWLLADGMSLAGLNVISNGSSQSLIVVAATTDDRNSPARLEYYRLFGPSGRRLPNNPPQLTITSPCAVTATPPAGACVFTDTRVAVPIRLNDPEGDPVRAISVTFSIDGGSTWSPAAGTLSSGPPATGLISGSVLADCTNAPCSYQWDLRESGIFGQLDAVVVRVIAYPSASSGRGAAPGPSQYPFVVAQTMPFRVSGSQVKVNKLVLGAGCATTEKGKCNWLPLITNRSLLVIPSVRTSAPTEPGALVFRIPADEQVGELLVDSGGQPYRTDSKGVLQGSETIARGSRLVALLPYAQGDRFTVYRASAGPDLVNDDWTSDALTYTGDLIVLNPSADHPLVVFDLSVSLEWDLAPNDPYWERLERDLQRTSALIYDWTNGQAAIGEVNVYDNKANWRTADIQVFASNNVRPNATVGGIDSHRVDSGRPPGQIRIGATWNRYGERSSNLGEDWALALAHELGHYAFFLYDNYLGLDAEGRLVDLSDQTCPGTMTNPYRGDSGPYRREFRPPLDWRPACADTLLERTYGRSDWEMMLQAYPWLRAPTGVFTDDSVIGPRRQLLDLTRVKLTRTCAGIPESTVACDDEEEAKLVTLPIVYYDEALSDRARAYLFVRPDGVTVDRLIDLGRPIGGEVLARGAHKDDRVCIFDPAQAKPLRGCQVFTSSQSNTTLLVEPAARQPELLVTPINSQTVVLTMTDRGLPASLVAEAIIFPATGDNPATEVFTWVTTGTFTATVKLEAGATAGYVYVVDPAGTWEVVTAYGLGGSPLPGASSRGVDADAPVLSPDGQVVVYGLNLDFSQGEFYTLQQIARPGVVPEGRTPVGQTYRLIGSQNAPPLAGANIGFSYLGREVPPTEEQWIRVYYYDEAAPQNGWQLLPNTVVVTEVNLASAPLRGPGIYTLMSSIEVPLDKDWNLFAYPVPGSRPVADALRSIDGLYETVYEFDPFVPQEQWKVYEPNGRKTLTHLRFGYGYWILMKRPATLYLLGVGTEDATAQVADTGGSAQSPSAIFYGPLTRADGATLLPGAEVIATVDGVVCGRATVGLLDGQAHYALLVAADGPAHQGCGAEGRSVQLSLSGKALAVLPWADGPRRLPLEVRP